MSSVGGQISDTVGNVRNTFSSWDTCMSKSYCKYPVIVGIIIGAIILISVVWCFASCLCCGATLCGSCAKCLTCCNCCGLCGRGGSSGGGKTRHKDDYTQMPPTPYNGYQPQPSPMSYQPPTSGPQFAQFDASTKKVHADSLPAMPSWENARTVRVEDHTEQANGFGHDVEMGAMPPRQPQNRTRGGYNQVPNGPVSPVHPPSHYDHFEGQPQQYSSDLGAQRLGQQQTGYAEYDPSPMSPAPTYRTNPTVAGTTDRFGRGGMSPVSEHSRSEYFSPARDQAWSPISHGHQEATQYHSYTRSLSPPTDHYASDQNYSTQEVSAARPPSLLQVGRKPVGGTQREI